MRRWLPLVLLLVVLIAGLFWTLRKDEEFVGPGFERPEVLRVEQILSRHGIPDAEAAIADVATVLPAPALEYLESAVHLRAGRFEEARAAAAEARREHPFAWRPMQVEYAALMNLGRVREAGLLADAAVENRPFDERVLVLAAEHQLSLPEPDWKRADAYLDRASRLSERVAPPGDPTAVDDESLFLLRGRVLLAEGRRLTALDVARQGVRNWPRNAHLRVQLGEAARVSGRLAEAVAEFRSAIELAPDDPMVRPWHENLVQLLLVDDANAQAALVETERLLARWPDVRTVRVLRARALVRAQRFDEAVDIYEKLYEEDAYDPTVLRNLAVLLYDWKQGGQDGRYLDRSHDLLRRYVRLGGELDDRIRDTWNALAARASAGDAGGDDLATLRAAWEARPADSATLGPYVQSLRLGGHTQEAGTVVRQSLAAAGGDPAIGLIAAQWFLDDTPDYDAQMAARLVDAAAARLQATGELPENVLWTRCRARLAAYRAEEAHADAVALVARRRVGPYLRLVGAAARDAGRFREAEQAYRDALALEPDRNEWRAEMLDMLLDGVHLNLVPAQGTLDVVLDDVLSHLDRDGGPPALRVIRAATLAMREGSAENGIARLEELLDNPSYTADGAALKHFARAALKLHDAEAVLSRFDAFVAAGGRITPALDVERRKAAER